MIVVGLCFCYVVVITICVLIGGLFPCSLSSHTVSDNGQTPLHDSFILDQLWCFQGVMMTNGFIFELPFALDIFYSKNHYLIISFVFGSCVSVLCSSRASDRIISFIISPVLLSQPHRYLSIVDIAE